jgi:hypothetical protein
MKVRRDFVTNSSSSSFIISKNNVSRDQLLELLLEIANIECKKWTDEPYTLDDITDECVAYRYHIEEATKDDPALICNGWGWFDDDIKYDNHFIIDNDGCCRYDWTIIEQVLSKYNIPFEYGYCD